MRGTAIAITGSTLIDGTGAEPWGPVTVLIDGNRIAAVGPAGKVEVPQGTQVFEARGKTMMPGLIDAHVHIESPGDLDPTRRLRELIPFSAVRATVHARLMLEAGFTAVRDAGGIGYVAIGVRQAIDLGLVAGPRVQAAGHPLHMTGGHGGTFYAPEIRVDWAGEVDGADEARKAARLQLKMGADVIKLIASTSGGALSTGIATEAPQLTVEEMKAAVDEAHKAGKRAMAHAHAAQAIKNAIMAGIDTIEHGSRMDDEGIEMMLERDIPVVTAGVPPFRISQHGVDSGVPEYAVRKARADVESRRGVFEKWLSAGVKIALGTDCGTPFNRPGENAVGLEVLVMNGLTTMQAIVSSTRIAAEALGMADRTGTIQQGKLADILILDGDPLTDIRVLQDKQKLLLIMKDGLAFKNHLG